MTVTYRYAAPDDRAFILSSWAQSYNESRDIAFIPKRAFSSVMQPFLGKLLDRSRAIVACHVDDGSILYGFICFEAQHVHYIDVKLAYRRMGIATGLFLAARIDPDSAFRYSCRTRASWEAMATGKRCQVAKYDPFHSRYDQPKEST